MGGFQHEPQPSGTSIAQRLDGHMSHCQCSKRVLAVGLRCLAASILKTIRLSSIRFSWPTVACSNRSRGTPRAYRRGTNVGMAGIPARMGKCALQACMPPWDRRLGPPTTEGR
jgi:hypothetical protein